MPICFFDNDVILKLAAFDLFGEALNILGVTQQELRVLDTAIHKFRKDRRLKQKYTDDGIDRAIQIVQYCPKINEKLDPDEMNQLSNIEGIDPGEAVLVAATRNQEIFYLTTGDKRFLKALAGASGLNTIRQRLSKRVICLEQLILEAINNYGFMIIRDKIVPVRDCDTAIRAAFGSGQQATQENVVLTLNGYVQELKQQTGDLLIEL